MVALALALGCSALLIPREAWTRSGLLLGGAQIRALHHHLRSAAKGSELGLVAFQHPGQLEAMGGLLERRQRLDFREHLHPALAHYARAVRKRVQVQETGREKAGLVW